MIGRVEPVGAALNRDGVQAAVGNAGGRLAFFHGCGRIHALPRRGVIAGVELDSDATLATGEPGGAMVQTSTFGWVVGGLVLAVGMHPGQANVHAKDEEQIRALIAQRDAGTRLPTTPDRVLWMASFQKPIVGNETPTLRTHERGIENRVPNSEKAHTDVQRIVVSQSGDLAYEYSNGTIAFDLLDGRHISSPNSTLRVWQKQDGQWKQAAAFTITHYRD